MDYIYYLTTPTCFGLLGHLQGYHSTYPILSQMNPLHTVLLFSPKFKPPFMFTSHNFSLSYVAAVDHVCSCLTEYDEYVQHVTLGALVTFKIVSISVLNLRNDVYHVWCTHCCEDWYWGILPRIRRHFVPRSLAPHHLPDCKIIL